MGETRGFPQEHKKATLLRTRNWATYHGPGAVLNLLHSCPDLFRLADCKDWSDLIMKTGETSCLARKETGGGSEWALFRVRDRVRDLAADV